METRLTKLETQFETVIPTLATKSDIGNVRAEIGNVRAEIKSDIGNVRAEIEVVRAEIHKSTSDIVKWVVGTAVAMSALGLTVMTFVLNNATPKMVAQPAAPIVITVPALPSAALATPPSSK